MKTKRQPTSRQTAARRGVASEAQDRARNDARARLRCNGFLLWLACNKNSCRRTRSCVGNPHACWDRHWRPLSNEDRQWCRTWLRAVFVDRKEPREAVQIADAEAAHYAAMIARAAAGRTNPVAN